MVPHTDRHQPVPGEDSGSWNFLTNHAHVLVALYRDPDLRQRDIAGLVGITEGAVQRILNELEHTGYLSIERVGRRNHYEVDTEVELRHPLDAGHNVGDMLRILGPTSAPETQAPNTAPSSDQEQSAA